jgi:hypothetical protein
MPVAVVGDLVGIRQIHRTGSPEPSQAFGSCCEEWMGAHISAQEG